MSIEEYYVDGEKIAKSNNKFDDYYIEKHYQNKQDEEPFGVVNRLGEEDQLKEDFATLQMLILQEKNPSKRQKLEEKSNLIEEKIKEIQARKAS